MAVLEVVEKLLTDAMVALLDGAEREHATRVPHRRIAGRAGYWSWLGVALAHKALTIFQPWRVCTSWRYSM